jgi:hypothetical protein
VASNTDLAESILRAHVPASKAESDSIRTVLRLIADRNQNVRRSATRKVSDIGQSHKEPSCI